MSANNFIICAFATKGTSYVDIATTTLLDSLNWIELEYDFHVVPNLGSWQKNTSYKATFAKEMLLKHNRNVVLLDVDCRVFRYPELFNLIPEQYNIAAHHLDHDTWYQNNSHKKEFLSGTLFLRNVPQTFELVTKWEDRCKISTEWEQKILDAVIKENSVEVFDLPLRYCYINEVRPGQPPFIACDDVVIKHYQASRTEKRHITA